MDYLPGAIPGVAEAARGHWLAERGLGPLRKRVVRPVLTVMPAIAVSVRQSDYRPSVPSCYAACCARGYGCPDFWKRRWCEPVSPDARLVDGSSQERPGVTGRRRRGGVGDEAEFLNVRGAAGCGDSG